MDSARKNLTERPFLARCIKIAKEEAFKSTHQHKLAAIIFHKKSIISIEHNHSHSHRKHLHPKFTNYKHSIHAEVAAIIAAKTNLNNSTMLVVRINSQGELRNAKPCENCMKYILYVGIKKIIYSTNNGSFEEIKI